MYHSIDHLQDILCSNSVEMSVKAVDLINEKVKKHPLYGKMTGSHSKAFNTTTTDSVNHIPSMLALELSGTKWLYDKTGTLQSPADIKKSDLAVQYSGHGAEIFAQLPFKAESEAVETVIQSVEEPYQAFISAMLKRPDELRLMCETYQKLQKKRQKETDKTQSLTELLEKQSSAQTEVETEPAPDDETLGEYGAVRNLKHREKSWKKTSKRDLKAKKQLRRDCGIPVLKATTKKRLFCKRNILVSARFAASRLSDMMENHTSRRAIFCRRIRFRQRTSRAYQRDGTRFAFARTVQQNSDMKRKIFLNLSE